MSWLWQGPLPHPRIRHDQFSESLWGWQHPTKSGSGVGGEHRGMGGSSLKDIVMLFDNSQRKPWLRVHANHSPEGKLEPQRKLDGVSSPGARLWSTGAGQQRSHSGSSRVLQRWEVQRQRLSGLGRGPWSILPTDSAVFLQIFLPPPHFPSSPSTSFPPKAKHWGTTPPRRVV